MMKRFAAGKKLNVENCESDELPPLAQRALHNYPRIAASPEFNRRVLEKIAVASRPSRLELFCDRMDEVFARPILKLLGAACLGAMFALVGTSAFFAAGGEKKLWSTPERQAETRVASQSLEPSTGAAAFALYARSRIALMREMEIPFAARPNYPLEYSRQRAPEFSSPTKREKTIEDAPDERSSSCPVAFHSPV